MFGLGSRILHGLLASLFDHLVLVVTVEADAVDADITWEIGTLRLKRLDMKQILVGVDLEDGRLKLGPVRVAGVS